MLLFMASQRNVLVSLQCTLYTCSVTTLQSRSSTTLLKWVWRNACSPVSGIYTSTTTVRQHSPLRSQLHLWHKVLSLLLTHFHCENPNETFHPYYLWINVKTVVYTRVNGASHIENCKNYKKVITHQHIALVSMCCWVIAPFCNFCSFRCVMRR